jgi:hypothetical protein
MLRCPRCTHVNHTWSMQQFAEQSSWFGLTLNDVAVNGLSPIEKEWESAFHSYRLSVHST